MLKVHARTTPLLLVRMDMGAAHACLSSAMFQCHTMTTPYHSSSCRIP